MAKPKVQTPYIPPISTRIRRVLISFFRFPFRVARRYGGYNFSIGEMRTQTSNKDIANDLKGIQKRNNLLVHGFIYFPLFLGFVALIVSIYLNRHDVSFWVDRVFAPIYTDGFFKVAKVVFKRISYGVGNFPIGILHLQWCLWGFLASWVGARLLSLNFAFKEEERIKHIFATLGYIDSAGQPWRVTWTYSAIMITAFNCDPIQLCQNNRFWSSLNFPPSPPKVFEGKMDKFIVERKFELPSKLTYDIKTVGDLKSGNNKSFNKS